MKPPSLSWLVPASHRGLVLALAPMQDVTDLPFMTLLDRYGGPDVYYTEYFRVYPGSHLDKTILSSITRNPTGKPVIAQMIGNDVEALVRSANELQRHAVAGIDLNLGCPAPVVYRKCAGGGLLRDLKKIDEILRALRAAVAGRFTVKTRIGFENAENFRPLLEIFAQHQLDLVTVHGRTVKEMYRSEVHYEYIQQAVETLPCPVLANGNVYSAKKALEVAATTGSSGLMIGRGAIRNPWLFSQIKAAEAGLEKMIPTGWQVRDYIRDLYAEVKPSPIQEKAHVQKMKKYLNYIGIGIEPSGAFLHGIRRVETEKDFFELCDRFLSHDQPMELEPFVLPLKECDFMAGAQT